MSFLRILAEHNLAVVVERKGGSENPADPEKTTRVLTIMFASDY